MFSLGAVTSKFTSSKWWKAGLFFMVNGGFAAGISYVIGVIANLILESTDNSTKLTIS